MSQSLSSSGEVASSGAEKGSAASNASELAAPSLTTPRGQDVVIKHRRVAEFLDDEGYDAVLLSRQDNFAWFTSGGDNSAGVASDAGTVSLFVTREGRCILADNVESGRTFEEEVAGLGFGLKECSWHEPKDRLVSDICRGRRVASDTGQCGTINELEKLSRLRINLTELEQKRFRELGRGIAHAVEATCRNSRPGMTEHEIAAELSHRLIRHGIMPVSLYVAGEKRSAQFRRPIPTQEPIRRWFTIRTSARRYGLCGSVTRTVCFGRSDPNLVKAHHLCSMVDATYLVFSRHGELACEVLKKAERIYEKYGMPHEWQLVQQGGVTGYSPCEFLVVPGSRFRLRAGMAVAWTPSVGAARCGDTALLDQKRFEILTPNEQWPTLTVSVREFEVQRPQILVLDV